MNPMITSILLNVIPFDGCYYPSCDFCLTNGSSFADSVIEKNLRDKIYNETVIVLHQPGSPLLVREVILESLK